MDENAGRIGKADRVLSPTATEPEVSAHSGDAPLRGLYIYAVSVSRQEPTRILSSLVQGYRIADSEDEARGMAYAAAVESKPDMRVDQLLVLRVSDLAIRLAAAALEGVPSGKAA